MCSSLFCVAPSLDLSFATWTIALSKTFIADVALLSSVTSIAYSSIFADIPFVTLGILTYDAPFTPGFAFNSLELIFNALERISPISSLNPCPVFAPTWRFVLNPSSVPSKAIKLPSNPLLSASIINLFAEYPLFSLISDDLVGVSTDKVTPSILIVLAISLTICSGVFLLVPSYISIPLFEPAYGSTLLS